MQFPFAFEHFECKLETPPLPLQTRRLESMFCLTNKETETLTWSHDNWRLSLLFLQTPNAFSVNRELRDPGHAGESPWTICCPELASPGDLGP